MARRSRPCSGTATPPLGPTDWPALRVHVNAVPRAASSIGNRPVRSPRHLARGTARWVAARSRQPSWGGWSSRTPTVECEVQPEGETALEGGLVNRDVDAAPEVRMRGASRTSLACARLVPNGFFDV